MTKTNPFHILVADDDADDLEFIQQAFLQADDSLTISLVHDGSEAISRLENNPSSYPDLLVLDLNMPKFNGFDTLKFLRSRPLYQKLPVYIYSTTNDHRTEQLCMELGASGFYTKPDNYAMIMQTAKDILAAARALKAISLAG